MINVGQKGANHETLSLANEGSLSPSNVQALSCRASRRISLPVPDISSVKALYTHTHKQTKSHVLH